MAAVVAFPPVTDEALFRKMECDCVDLGHAPCGKRADRCESRLCLICGHRHPLRRSCMFDCGCVEVGSETPCREITCNHRSCSLCDARHDLTRACPSGISNIPGVINALTDAEVSDCLKLKRLAPVADSTTKNCVNTFIEETYDADKLPMHCCAVCGRMNAIKSLYKHSLDEPNLVELVGYDEEKENGRPLFSRTSYVTKDDRRLIINREGVCEKEYCALLCLSCSSSVKRRKLPAGSYVNIDLGPKVDWLPDLTLAELLLLCEIRVSALVYRAVRGMRPGKTRQRHVKGHAIAFLRTHIGWLFDGSTDGRPCIAEGIDALATSLRVVCMSYVKTLDEARDLIANAKDLRVSTSKMRVWFTFLKQVRQHASAEFQEEWFRSRSTGVLHENGVPEVLLMSIKEDGVNFVEPNLDDELNGIHEGYTGDKFLDELDTVDDLRTKMSYVMPEETPSGTSDKCADGIVFTNVQQIASETCTAAHWYLAFPSIFKFGYGFPAIPTGKTRISINALHSWFDLLLNRIERKVVHHYIMPFYMGSINLRNETFISARYKMKSNDMHFVSDLNSQELCLLIDLLSKHKKFTSDVSARVRRAYQKVIACGRHIPKTEKMVKTKRFIVEKGFVPLFGPANVFLTINFNTENHVLFVKWSRLSDFQIKIKINKGRKYTKHNTTKSQRNVAAAKDPVICSKLFDFLVDRTLKYLLQVDDDFCKAKFACFDRRKGGVLGKLQWFVGETETNQRDFLHVHFTVRVRDYDNRFLSKHLENTYVRERLTTFVDSLAQADLIDGYDCCDTTNSAKFALQLKAEEEKRRKSSEKFPSRENVRFVSPPDDDLQMMVPCKVEGATKFREMKPVKIMLAITRRMKHYHRCSYTCFPKVASSRKARGAEKKRRCRLNNSRLRVRMKTFVKSSNGKVFVRRHLSRSVCSSDSCSYTLGCNVSIGILNATKAASSHFYTFSYGMKLNANVAVDIVYLKESMARKLTNATDSGTLEAAKLVQGLMNSLLGSMEWSGQEVAQLLAGVPFTYWSHEWRWLDWSALVTVLVAKKVILPEAFDQEVLDRHVLLSANGKVLDKVQDLAPVDSNISPYEIAMLYEQKTKPKRKKLAAPDICYHTESELVHRKYLKFTGTIRIPVLCGNGRLPEAEDKVYDLFICVVFSDLVTKVMKGTLTGELSAESIKKMAEDVKQSKPYVKVILENIAAWHESIAMAQNDDHAEDEDELASEDETELIDSTSSSRFNSLSEAHYARNERQIADTTATFRDALIDDSSVEDSIPSFDVVMVQRQLADDRALADRSYVASCVALLCSSFRCVYARGDLELRPKTSSGSRDRDGLPDAELSRQLRAEWRALKQSYTKQNEKLKNFIVEVQDEHSSKEWFRCLHARCLDANEWSEVSRRMYREQRRAKQRAADTRFGVVDSLKRMIDEDKWYMLDRPVTSVDVCKAFTLTKEQAFPVFVFVTYLTALQAYLVAPEASDLPEPLRLIMDGLPGSGKSHVLKAIQMLLFQRGLVHLAVCCAPTAKAALGMSTPVLLGDTIHSLFGLAVIPSRRSTITTRKRNSAQTVADNFRGKLFIFIDEVAMIPQDQLGIMNAQLSTLSSTSTWLLGGRSVLGFGDMCQLKLGIPLRRKVLLREEVDGHKHRWTKEKQLSAKSKVIQTMIKSSKRFNNQFIGRQCWLHMDFIPFYEVNRYRADTGGRRLAEIVQALRIGKVEEKHIEWLNSRYAVRTNGIDMGEDCWRQATIIHQRNAVLTECGAYSQVVAGLSKGMLVFIWDAVDFYKGSTRILKPEDYVRASAHKFTKAGYKTFVYYDGIVYNFVENRYVRIGWINKNDCTGVKIELHPVDKERLRSAGITSGVFRLTKQPLKIITKPKSRHSFDFGYGTGLVPVMKEKIGFKIIGDNGKEVNIERHGFVSLIFGHVKTDFGSQCMTVRYPNKVLTDLTFPADNLVNSESMLVTISRTESLYQIGLLLPLYRTQAEKQAYLKKLNAKIQIKDEERDEFLRIEKSYDSVIRRYARCREEANTHGVQRPETLKFCQFSEVLK